MDKVKKDQRDQRLLVSEVFSPALKSVATERIFNMHTTGPFSSQDEIVSVVEHISKLKELDDALI